jgi:hypothetical protein
MDGNHTALFMEFVRGREGLRRVPGLRSETGGTRDGICFVCFAFDSLKKELTHAGTSPWSVASKAEAQGLRSDARDAEIMGWR